VSRVTPAKDRVAVLLEFLGRQMTVELSMSGILKDRADDYVRAA
jgi:hypothetical protein